MLNEEQAAYMSAIVCAVHRFPAGNPKRRGISATSGGGLLP